MNSLCSGLARSVSVHGAAVPEWVGARCWGMEDSRQYLREHKGGWRVLLKMLIRNFLLDSETAKLAKRRRAKPLAEDIKYKQKNWLGGKKIFHLGQLFCGHWLTDINLPAFRLGPGDKAKSYPQTAAGKRQGGTLLLKPCFTIRSDAPRVKVWAMSHFKSTVPRRWEHGVQRTAAASSLSVQP